MSLGSLSSKISMNSLCSSSFNMTSIEFWVSWRRGKIVRSARVPNSSPMIAADFKHMIHLIASSFFLGVPFLPFFKNWSKRDNLFFNTQAGTGTLVKFCNLTHFSKMAVGVTTLCLLISINPLLNKFKKSCRQVRVFPSHLLTTVSRISSSIFSKDLDKLYLALSIWYHSLDFSWVLLFNPTSSTYAMVVVAVTSSL